MNDFWHLRNVDWLRELPAAVAEKLRGSARLRDFPRGGLIFEPNIHPENVFLLDSGLVRIYRESDQADEVTFGYVHPGEIFGECAVFKNRSRESFAAAQEPSTVLRFSRKHFTAALRSCPSLMLTVVKQIEGRFKNVESRVEDLVFRDARSRLAHVIQQLCDEFGRCDGNRTTIGIRLTQAEIGTLIGASRPTVSIALGELEKAGIISRTDGCIAVNEHKMLGQIANMNSGDG